MLEQIILFEDFGKESSALNKSNKLKNGCFCEKAAIYFYPLYPCSPILEIKSKSKLNLPVRSQTDGSSDGRAEKSERRTCRARREGLSRLHDV